MGCSFHSVPLAPVPPPLRLQFLSLALWLEASAPYGSVYAQFIPASLLGVP